MAWSGKLDFYDQLFSKDNLREGDEEPNIQALRWYVDCFFELNTCRNTMSLSPISFTDIANFAILMRVEDMDEFLYYIRVMDKVFLEMEGKGNA